MSNERAERIAAALSDAADMLETAAYELEATAHDAVVTRALAFQVIVRLVMGDRPMSGGDSTASPDGLRLAAEEIGELIAELEGGEGDAQPSEDEALKDALENAFGGEESSDPGCVVSVDVDLPRRPGAGGTSGRT